MKETKNNTCRKCGKHINKSNPDIIWDTFIRSTYQTTEGKTIPAEKVVLCQECGGDIWLKVCEDVLFKEI